MENYKTVENWNSILFGDISASATSLSCTENEWALFPTEFPFLLTLEKYSWVYVIKREIVKVTNRVWDLFTVVRHFKACVQDDTAEPKTSTNNWLTFSSWDSITNAIYAENDKDIKTELVLKANTTDVITKIWNQTIDWELTVTKIKWDWSELSWINAVVSSASLELMMSVNWTAWLAYSKADYEQLDYSTGVDLWTTTQPQIAQSFYWQLAYTWNVIPLMVKTVWSPDDWIYLEIQTDNAWVPSWTVVTNWTSDTIDYTNIAGAYEEENFTFSGWIVALTVWELYHFVLKRTGGNSDVNYYTFGSAGTDALFGNISLYNGSAWSTDTNDLYFKFPWYKMAVLGWNNFIWILQVNKNIWETWKFNTWYDNNQTWLVPESKYWYNISTWIIELWWDFKAISETEININIKELNIFGWDWSDWDLVILDTETVTLTAWQEYNYNSIDIQTGWTLTMTGSWELKIKCINGCNIDWIIDIDWKWDNSDLITMFETLSPWSAWLWWAWGNWGNWEEWGSWASWWAEWSWYGWGGWGGWADSSYSWWTWWTWWTPWGLGWAAKTSDWHWNPWGLSAGWSWGNAPWGSWASWPWANAYWNNAVLWTDRLSWGWGWGGWALWLSGWSLLIYAKYFGWNWTITSIWWNWWNWWNWNKWGATAPDGWGWGWGGWGTGGWGWVVCLYSENKIFSWTITVTWWAWWTWWVWWGSTYWQAGQTGTTWWVWGTWNSANKLIKNIF